MALNINGTTGISGVDGSVSAPALTGTDSNTGITFPSADTIKFSTGGVERMAITNSGVTGVGGGITMSDQWRLTTTYSVPNASDTYITSNWERVDSDGFGQLGTGMTESSGEFTFPSTGIYLITWHVDAYASSGALPRGMNRIYTATDGSSYGWAANANCTMASGGYSTTDALFQFDVTNTSTHKVKFLVYYQAAGVQMVGNTNSNQTYATFTRLGDT